MFDKKTTFKDTRNAGGVSVRGFYLESDAQGYIEAPRELRSELEPHGFLLQERPAVAMRPPTLEELREQARQAAEAAQKAAEALEQAEGSQALTGPLASGDAGSTTPEVQVSKGKSKR